MNELRAIVKAADRARHAGQPALLATVVRVRGSAYRRPGARMLLTEEGWQAGSISGGCLEADILRKAWWRTRGAQPVVVTYDSSVSADSPESADLADELSHGFGLGCNGIVDVLLERIAPDAPASPIDHIARCLCHRRSGAMATVIAVEKEGQDVSVGQRLLLDDRGEASETTITAPDLIACVTHECRAAIRAGASRSATFPFVDGATADVFVEVIHPPLPLLICGAGHDAVPLARMAGDLGWAVTVIEPRPGALARADRFPGAEAVLSCAPSGVANAVPIDSRTAAVIMTHNTGLDAALLAELLATPARYIGVLGPRHRTERLIASLRDDGMALPGLDRLHGPVGLDLGADGPEAIALSILAEIQAVVAGKTGGMLRERRTDASIHGVPPLPDVPERNGACTIPSMIRIPQPA